MIQPPKLPMVLLVGHRASGKSTLGRLIAEHAAPFMAEDKLTRWRFVDLDEEIERDKEKTCAQLIEEDEQRFRQTEFSRLFSIFVERQPNEVLLVAVGAGFEPLVEAQLLCEAICVWIWRDEWEKTALKERARLRPELEFSAEVEWMRRRREPVWAATSQLFFELPRGRAPRYSAKILADYIRWSLQSRSSPTARRTWLVPGTLRDSPRARLDAELFGLAGIEDRSDLYTQQPNSAAPQHRRPNLFTPELSTAFSTSASYLASLRTPDLYWLRRQLYHSHCIAVDIDLRFLPDVLAAGILDEYSPRPLILSTHPSGPGEANARALLKNAALIRRQYPAWSAQLSLKYAPSPQSFAELRACFKLARMLKRATLQAQANHPESPTSERHLPLTFLPQGRRFAWTRALLSAPQNPTGITNAYNYVCAELRASRLTHIPGLYTAPGTMNLTQIGFVNRIIHREEHLTYKEQKKRAKSAREFKEYLDKLTADFPKPPPKNIAPGTISLPITPLPASFSSEPTSQAQLTDSGAAQSTKADSPEEELLPGTLQDNPRPSLTPMDLQDWLPYFDLHEQIDFFDALVGDPVAPSQGDRWHTAAAERDDSKSRYLKITLSGDLEERELEEAFNLFAAIGVRGVSVTSPMKARVGELIHRRVRLAGASPLNTLRFEGWGTSAAKTRAAHWQDWLGCDTDEIGMLAALDVIEEHLRRLRPRARKTPYRAALIGRGAVTPAIRRALKHRAWHLVIHAGARAGWPQEPPEEVDLLINAAGPWLDVSSGAPRAAIWLDLHYQQNRAPAPKPALHLNGDQFFVAQARAQREFWKK